MMSMNTAPVLNKAKNGLKGFFLRLLVHILALCAAFILEGKSNLPGNTANIVVFSIYIGLICLFARGVSWTPGWLIPAGFGLLQTLICLFVVSPIVLSIFWGGAQAWIQRGLQKKWKMGTEWVVLFFLIIISYNFLNDFTVSIILLFSFPLLVLAGWTIKTMQERRENEIFCRKMANVSVVNLQRLLDGNTLPDPFEKFAKELVELTPLYMKSFDRLPKEALELITALNGVTNRLENLHGIILFGSDDSRIKSLREEMAKIIDIQRSQIASQKTDRVTNSAKDVDQNRDQFAKYHASIMELVAKKESLPEELQIRIDGIQRHTEDILECMRTDPRDVAPGTRFLDRYLKAAHKVVDEYTRFSGKDKEIVSVSQVLEKSQELMARLETAFASEHNNLLQNDVVDFSAELKVLDTLLKMNGK